MQHEHDQQEKREGLSRRTFLKGVGALAAAASTSALAACNVQTDTPGAASGPATRSAVPVPVQYPATPYTPTEPPPAGLLRVLSAHEARTVEALSARILPGTPDDPGAREAGVVFYIDNFLAYQEGLPEPTYRAGPFAQTFAPASPQPEAVQWYQQQGLPLPTGGQQSGGQQSGGQQSGQPTPTPPLPQDNQRTPTPNSVGAQLAPTATVPPVEQIPGSGQSNAEATSQAGDYQAIWLPADVIERYGYQSMLTPRDVYRLGLAALDRYANTQFGKDFIDLSEHQQDQIVGDMVEGRATSFDRALSAQAFFHNVRRHTSEGMFSDPAYGGNRNLVGWKLVGYPGAQRGYDPSEFQREGTSRQPQSIAMMHPFNPGQPINGQVLLPVSGSRADHQQPPAPPAEHVDDHGLPAR